jgi:hypothetical protein
VDRIITSCARLPLTLSIVAARAATRPAFPLATLAAELRVARTDLDAFATDDARADARAAFSCSYQALSPAAARMFRLLGLYPGADIAPPAAASLAGAPARQAKQSLAELARAHVVTEHLPGRYRFHNLLRAYATELVRTVEPGRERHAVTHRMLDHYLHTAAAAYRMIHPQRDRVTLPPARPGVTVTEIADHQQASAWLASEGPVLLAAVRLAAADGFPDHAVQLARTLAELRDPRGHRHDVAMIQHAAAAGGRWAGGCGRQ